MNHILQSLVASLLVAAGLAVATASAAPLNAPGATATAGTKLVTPAGGPRSYSGDCKPYNGPYGYYGNPYCEGGFSRYGDAGGYEIDLTRFFDERYYTGRYDRERRARRSR